MGLGNPGSAYRNNWHNAGFQVIDGLVREYSFAPAKGLWRGHISGEAVTLFKPLSYMNLSGLPVRRCLDQLGLGPENLLVVHDDLDLPRGRLRFKLGGGSGGHRGVDSLAAVLGSEAFLRLKLGIGRPPPGIDPRSFVLSPPEPEEEPAWRAQVDRAVQAVVTWLTEGLEAAMRAFHLESGVDRGPAGIP